MILIGEKIKEVWQSSGMTITEFAKRINTSRENVYGIFKRKTVDTGLLHTISSVLDYNFFLEYIKDNEESILQEPTMSYGRKSHQKNKELLTFILESMKQQEKILTKIQSKLTKKEVHYN